MLPGETGRRQILGSRRAAHRNCDFGTASLFEPAIGGGDFCAKFGIAGGVVNQAAGGGAALGKQCHILVVEAREKPAQLRPNPGLGDRRPIGLRGQRKTVGYPLAQQRAQFAERCGLTADRRHVLQSDILEPADMVCGGHKRSPAAVGAVADNAATG